ncbi:MAG: cytochrome c maturation protein CcmE [Chloroflexi bacterium]|nr:cytochrome c maturation protein CcmE [Chloroflexota bacterium]
MQNVIATPDIRATTSPRAGSLKFLIAGVLIVAAMAFAVLASFQDNTVYYLTLPEFSAQKAKFAGQVVRVNGPLDQASIQLDQKTMVLKFNMKDGGIVQPVVYKGVVPDTLTNGESVVAEGKLDAQGVFQANSILVKCPSKYEESK